jgi:hypothetical protein
VPVAVGVFHQWWLHCTGGGCVTPVVVVELSVVSLRQTYIWTDFENVLFDNQ